MGPFTVNANFHGVNQSGSNCGGCQPPDVNAAVSPTQIAEAVNLRLQVYSTSGKSLCGIGLNTLANTTAPLSDPRIMWDNAHKRFFMVFIPVPTTDSATPAEYLLATQTASACGSWFVYNITFSGPASMPLSLFGDHGLDLQVCSGQLIGTSDGTDGRSYWSAA